MHEAWNQEEEESPPHSFRNTTDNDPDMRASTGSPSSADGDLMADCPDLSFRCEQCDAHIHLRLLQEHRQYHTALDVMRYRDGSMPTTVPKLLQRRRAILKKLKSQIDSEKPIDHNIVQEINDAYEILKSHLEETFECYRRIKEDLSTDVEAVAVNTEVDGVLSIGICSTQNGRWKSKMEDTQTFVDAFGGDVNKLFLGLYDGHHGRFAAEKAATELHHALLHQMASFDQKVTWNDSVAANLHSENNLNDVWKVGLEDEGIAADEGICVIQQVIKGYEEKQERLRRERKKEGELDDGAVKEEVKKSATKSARKKKYGNAYSELVEEAFNKAYMYTDLLLSWGKEEHSRIRWSGCSALSCIIENTGSKPGEGFKIEHQGSSTQREGERTAEEPQELARLHLAHAGNVQCVLIRGNQTYRLTKDHSPNNPRERARIEKLGGTVSESNRDVRINGILSASHGLGNHGDMALKRCISRTPYTTVVPLDQYCQLLVMATNGVWEVFTEEEAAHVLLEMLPGNQVAAPSHIGTSIHHLLAAKSRSQSIDTSHIPASELYERLRAYSSMTAASVPLPDHLLASPDTKRRNPPEHHNKTETTTQDAFSHDDRVSDESGNEADVETNIDHMTIPPISRMSLVPPTKDEIHREFAKILSERLVQAAILAGSKDNVSVMVVVLPGSGI